MSKAYVKHLYDFPEGRRSLYGVRAPSWKEAYATAKAHHLETITFEELTRARMLGFREPESFAKFAIADTVVYSPEGRIILLDKSASGFARESSSEDTCVDWSSLECRAKTALVTALKHGARRIGRDHWRDGDRTKLDYLGTEQTRDDIRIVLKPSAFSTDPVIAFLLRNSAWEYAAFQVEAFPTANHTSYFLMTSERAADFGQPQAFPFISSRFTPEHKGELYARPKEIEECKGTLLAITEESPPRPSRRMSTVGLVMSP